MATSAFSLPVLVARLVKVGMVAVLLPIAIGLLLGMLQQLEQVSFSGATFREWAEWGFLTYVGVHLLLYRPARLFRISHRLFSVLAVWLFGGQVTSVEEADGGKRGKGKGEAPADPAAQGSTLVAFSPYVVPLYTVLVCAGGWALRRWGMRASVDGPIGFLLGLTMAFHWIMTADDLQQQRKRWHLETYLLALGLVFVMTLLIAAGCLPWAVPGFSFIQALSDGLTHAHAIYTTSFQQLFL